MDDLPSSSAAATAALVFPSAQVTQTVEEGSRHAPGCIKVGLAWVAPDGRTSPLRSKASNRCEACARSRSWENVTMLRQDAEDNSAPDYVLTLTSVRVAWTSAEYGRACATFWQAFRRRWGHVEYCGFVEWTTGQGERSGGHRRQHVHWLLKVGRDLDVDQVQAWVSAEWRKLTGAWRVELAALETVGGVVGYLALHHEKWEQRPPDGWTGRRLRPSKGYFSESGHLRRARAQLWLQQHRHGQEDEHGIRRELPPAGGRIVSRGRPFTEIEGVAASTALDRPGPSLDSLPARRALDRRLSAPYAPINAPPPAIAGGPSDGEDAALAVAAPYADRGRGGHP